MGKAKKKSTEPGAAESNGLPGIERRSARAKKKTTYFDHTKPEERNVPTRFSLRSRDIPPSPPYTDDSRTTIRLTKISESEEPAEPNSGAEGGIEVEGEAEEESPPFESFDEVSPFDDEDNLESTEDHVGPPKPKKAFVELVESLVSPFDPKPKSNTPPPPVPAAAVDEELEFLKSTVEDIEEEFNSGELQGTRLDRAASLQSLLDQGSDTGMTNQQPQNQRNNRRKALDFGDPLAVGRILWRNLISRNNFIQTIRSMDHNNRGQNRYYKRQFTRHRLRVSTLFKKYQKMVDSLQDQLVPTQQEIELLRAMRNQEMKDLEAHSTMQVSEDMLKFQDQIRQFSEKNAAAEKVLRTELNQRESEINLQRLRRRLKAANVEILELKMKADAQAPVQQEDDIPVSNPIPPRSPTPTPELPGGECPPEYEQVETISDYSDDADDDNNNQANSSYEDQEEFHSTEDDEGGSGPAPLSDNEFVNQDENEHSDHEEHFLTPTGSPAHDHIRESQTSVDVDVEGSQSEVEVNELDTQKMMDRVEELGELAPQSADLNLDIGMTQSQDEGNPQVGHGLSASETEAEVEDLAPPVSALPVGNPPLALSAPWQNQTSQFFLSQSDTDTDAGTIAPIEKEKVPDVPLFSNSDQEMENTETMSEVRLYEPQTSVKAKPCSGSGRLSESCSDVGGTRGQRKQNSCKSGSGLDVKKAKKVPPTNVGPKALQVMMNSGLSNHSANLPQLSIGSEENVIPQSKKRPLKTDKKNPEISAPPAAKKLPDMTGFKAHVQKLCANSESEYEEKMRRRSLAKSTSRDKSTPKGLGTKRRSSTQGSSLVKTSLPQMAGSKYTTKNLPLSCTVNNNLSISTATSESDMEILNRKSAVRQKVHTVLEPEADSPGRTSPAKKTSVTSPSKVASSTASGTGNFNPNGPETQTQPQPQMPYQQPQQQWQPQYGQQGAGAPYFDMFGYNSMMMASMFPGTRPGFNMQPPPGSFVPGMGPNFQGGNMGVGMASNFPPRMAPPYPQPTPQGMNFQQQHVPNAGMSNNQHQQQSGAPDSGMTNNFPQPAGGSNGGMNMNNFPQPTMNPYFQQGAPGGMNSNFSQPEAGRGGKRKKTDKNRNTGQGQGGSSHGMNQNFPQQPVPGPGMNPYQQGPAGPMGTMGYYQPGGMQGMNNMYQQQAGVPGMQNYQMGVPGGGGGAPPTNEVPVDGTSDDSEAESE